MVRSMINSSSQPARFKYLKAPATVVASLLILAGCSSPMAPETESSPTPSASVTQPSEPIVEQDDTETDDSALGANQATLLMAGQSFTFELTTCTTTDEELLIAGPGVDDGDNSPSYLDIEIGRVDGWFEGKVFVSLNSDQPEPSGAYFEATVGSGHEYSMGEVMDGYEIEVNFVSNAGVPIGPGSFLINCGPHSG